MDELSGKWQLKKYIFFFHFQVVQAILAEEDRVVVIRFGHDWDPTCMRMDEVGNMWNL